MILKYSLIIPHFNDHERLERLLNTVPVNRQDVEVLVVDDCSPDQSAIRALKDRWPMVRWLSTPENCGAGAARNVGLSHAQGERLVFADSDDEFLPEAFNAFDEHVQPEDELVYFFAEAMQEVDGEPSNRADRLNDLCQTYLDEQTKVALDCLKVRSVVAVAKVYSRKFIEKIGARFEETRVSNDVAFNVLAAVQTRHVRVVPVPVYRIYRRKGSLTSDPSPDAFLQRVNVMARLAATLKWLGIRDLPHGTGYMLISFTYGPLTAYRTWRICLRSDLRIELYRMLQFSRWRRFVLNLASNSKEKKRIK